MNSGQNHLRKNINREFSKQNTSDSTQLEQMHSRNQHEQELKGQVIRQKQPTIKKIQKVDLRQKHNKQNDSLTNLHPDRQRLMSNNTSGMNDNNVKSLDRSDQHPYFGNNDNQQYSSQISNQGQQIHYIQTDKSEFRGVSNITSRKKSINGSDFKERFQGRQSLMNKEGHIGVVMNANQPIKKVDRVQISQNLLDNSSKQSNQYSDMGVHRQNNVSMTPIAMNNRPNRHFNEKTISVNDDNNMKPAYNRNLVTPIQKQQYNQESSPASQKNYNFNNDYDGQNRTPMGIEKRPRLYDNGYTPQNGSIDVQGETNGRRNHRLGANSNFQKRFGSPESNLVGSLNGTFMGSNGAGVLPNGADGRGNDLSNAKQGSGVKSAQRSTNFVRAGNSISGSVQKQSINLSRSGNSIKPPRFSVQPQSQPISGIKDGQATNFNQNQVQGSNSNLPTQYSSSRFGNNNTNSRGQQGIPINPMGAVSLNGTGQNGFGAQSNSSHYNRNMSPQQPGGLLSGNGMIQQPASGGYMGQGLGMIGFLEPTGSDANSTSFYSNNTSVAQQIPSNLNNSRYLLNRRGEKLGTSATGVSKVQPMTKSIDGYGSHTSNFRNGNPVNYAQQNQQAMGINQQYNQQPHLKSSFYSSQNANAGNVPMGSSAYEKLQAKYGKQTTNISNSNYANQTPAIGSAGLNMGNNNNFQQQQNDGFPQLSPYRQRVKQRSIHKFLRRLETHPQFTL